MKFLSSAAIGAFLLIPAIAGAQTAAPAGAQAQAGAQATTPTVGATVYDSTGAVLGTVDQVTPQAVVINVGGTKVGLPPTSVGAGPNGLRVATTRADIEAQAKQAQAGQQAQLVSQLTAGTSVRGAGGATVGTVKAADAQYVTLTTPRGDVKLPIAAFSMGPNGPAITLTASQLDAAITQAGGGQAQPATDGTEAGGAAGAETPTSGSSADTTAPAAAAAAAGTTGAAAKATTRTQTRTTTTRRTRRTNR